MPRPFQLPRVIIQGLSLYSSVSRYGVSITAVDSIVGSKSVLRALVMAKTGRGEGGHIMRSFSDKGQVCEEACCEIDVVLLMAFPWMDVDMFLRITTIGEAARPSCELGKKFWCRKHGGFCPRSPLADHSVCSAIGSSVTNCDQLWPTVFSASLPLISKIANKCFLDIVIIF